MRMDRSLRVGFAALSLACLFTAEAGAQDRFATAVVDYQQGGGGGIFDRANLLGGPQGGGLLLGSLDVLSLGDGGQVTLSFDVTITDGPGADLIVYENGFSSGPNTSVFAEVARVEVSTDGVSFARFPSRYTNPGGLTNLGAYTGLPGGMPCIANVLTNTINPFDPVVSGGDALDLAELAMAPEVLAGQVDLSAIHFVRLLDVVTGTELDDHGNLILDGGGADFDAVAVVQHAGNQSVGKPRVDLWRDAQGFVHLDISDPDGIGDLDLATFRVSVNLVEIPFQRLRNFFVLANGSALGWELVSPQPVELLGLDAVLAVTISDDSGLSSSDQISLRH